MVLVSVSIVGRMALASRNEQPTTADSGTGDHDSDLTTLMPRDPSPPGETEKPAQAEEPSGVVGKLLPFLTEGGIAMLIGIALGVATRAVAKLAAIVLALIFIVIQFLAMKGVLTMDWGAFVLNVSSDEGLGSLVKYKLPAAGSLMIGYILGLKRG